MKIIFLDVDGVLNTQRQIMRQVVDNNMKSKSGMELNFDPRGMMFLKEIIEKTDAYIVISSTWRLHAGKIDGVRNINAETDDILWVGLMKNLESIGVRDRVIDVTPYGDKHRGDEIRYWLDHHKDLNIEQFVILDDDSDMCEFTNTNLAKCSWKYGLEEDVKDEALSILNGKGMIYNRIATTNEEE